MEPIAEVTATLAKLSGIRGALVGVLNENISRPVANVPERLRTVFDPADVGHYFDRAAAYLETLKKHLPDLYEDFRPIDCTPSAAMTPPTPSHFSRAQVERLVRDIEQIFEIRANSELAPPAADAPRRVFLTHGRSADWRLVQPFIERDVKLPTLELAQEPSVGRTIIEKLEEDSELCDSAVIVMTGDDVTCFGWLQPLSTSRLCCARASVPNSEIVRCISSR